MNVHSTSTGSPEALYQRQPGSAAIQAVHSQAVLLGQGLLERRYRLRSHSRGLAGGCLEGRNGSQASRYVDHTFVQFSSCGTASRGTLIRKEVRARSCRAGESSVGFVAQDCDRDQMGEGQSMRIKPWNRCQICGRLIAYEAFIDGRAVNRIVTPSSEFSDETFDTYHVACEAATQAPQESTNAASNDECEDSGRLCAPTTTPSLDHTKG